MDALASSYFSKDTLVQYFFLLEDKCKANNCTSYETILMWDCFVRIQFSENNNFNISNYKLDYKEKGIIFISFTFCTESKKYLRCKIEGSKTTKQINLEIIPNIRNTQELTKPIPDFYVWLNENIILPKS